MKLTAALIKAVLLRDRYRKSFCLPEYCPGRWWPCDVWEVTKAGYAVEYEIKTTVADFAADRDKQTIDPRTGEVRNKHELLAGECETGPSRFYFVCPAGMLPSSEIPRWAGHIEIEQIGNRPSLYSLRERVVKRAPNIHWQKVSDKVMAHARTVSYWRFHKLLQGLAAKHMREASDVTRSSEKPARGV